MARRSRPIVLAATIIGLAVWGAATALACVPQPLVTLHPRSSGSPGSEVTVRAVATPGNVEIRWNAADGPLLATAVGPTFSVPVKVPDDPAGMYAVVVAQRGPDGSLLSTGRAAFLIIGPSGEHDDSAAAPGPQQPGSSSSRPASSTGSRFAWGVGLGVLTGVGGVLLFQRRRRFRPTNPTYG